jgi:hypothetical protein
VRNSTAVLSPTARNVEIGSLILIAVAVLLGGRSLLVEIARFPVPAMVGLGIVGLLQLVAVRRNYLAGGAPAPVRVARDVAFLAAILAALAFVAYPARWSIGAAVSAALFGLAVELLVRFTPKAA